MSFQIKKHGVATTLFYLRCRESLAFSTTRSDSILLRFPAIPQLSAPRAIASSRAEAMRINSSPSLIFSRSDSISAGANMPPEDLAAQFVYQQFGVATSANEEQVCDLELLSFIDFAVYRLT
jgi:hypothetical protein